VIAWLQSQIKKINIGAKYMSTLAELGLALFHSINRIWKTNFGLTDIIELATTIYENSPFNLQKLAWYIRK
jgi:hypothetical protein